MDKNSKYEEKEKRGEKKGNVNKEMRKQKKKRWQKWKKMKKIKNEKRKKEVTDRKTKSRA